MKKNKATPGSRGTPRGSGVALSLGLIGWVRSEQSELYRYLGEETWGHFWVEKRSESRTDLKIQPSGSANRLDAGCENSKCKGPEVKGLSRLPGAEASRWKSMVGAGAQGLVGTFKNLSRALTWAVIYFMCRALHMHVYFMFRVSSRKAMPRDFHF